MTYYQSKVPYPISDYASPLHLTEQQINTFGAIPNAIWSPDLGYYIFPGRYNPWTRWQTKWYDGTTSEFDTYEGYHPTYREVVDEIASQTKKFEIWTVPIQRGIVWEPPENRIVSPWHFHPPFTLPKLTDDEFERKKAEYVAKYGYTVTCPGWEDIFHFKFPVVLTEEEEYLWSTGQKDKIPQYRREEIEEYKRKKRERYLQMLGSPTPRVVRALSSYATFLDDINDTLVTAAVVGRIAIKLFPKLAKRLVPIVGWALLGADILNVVTLFSLMPFLTQSVKRGHWTWSGLNPFSKEAKMRRAAKLMKWVPSFGDIVQALQVSDSMTGFGICLGPLMGYFQDYFFGQLRELTGEKVTYRGGGPEFHQRQMQAIRTMLQTGQIHQGGQVLSDEDHMLVLYAYLGAIRVIYPFVKDQDLTETLPNPTNWLIEAPAPRDPITIEVLNELGVDIEETRRWPSTGQRWSTIHDLIQTSTPTTLQTIRDVINRTRFDERFIMLGTLISEIGPEAYALFGGEDMVEQRLVPEAAVAQALLRSSYYFPYDVRPEQIQQLADWIHTYGEAYDEPPPTRDVLRKGESLGIVWRRTLPDRPVGRAAEIWPDFEELKILEPAGTFIY
jgi:hypothetical protein